MVGRGSYRIGLARPQSPFSLPSMATGGSALPLARQSIAQALWHLDPQWGHAPWRMSPRRTERVLHFHLGTSEEPQTSLCRALASLSVEGGYRRIDWVGRPHSVLQREAIDAAATHRPTLVFMQLQRPNVLAPSTVEALRRASDARDMVTISWCGDVGQTNGPFRGRGDEWGRELSTHCDLMLYSTMSQVRAHRSRGMLNAAYLQIGYDEDRYFDGPDGDRGSGFDVVFLGTQYSDHPWTSLPGSDAGLRRDVAALMRASLGARFGLFGQGWGDGVEHLPPARSGDVYRRSHLALNVSLCNSLERYSSDRLFRALACGSPVLMKAFHDWQSFGLRHGESVLVWETPEEALDLARTWLVPERHTALREIGRRGAALAREHHSWGARMQELSPLVAVARGETPEVTRPW
jgi:hypothetical protein